MTWWFGLRLVITGPARSSLVVAIAGLAAVIGSCTGDHRAEPQREGTIVIAYPHAANSMNPVDDEVAKYLVFLPLAVETESGELEGRLARWWEHSGDYREWTFHLRTDVRCHDGVPVTAHDVKFTLDLLAHPDVSEFGPGYVQWARVEDDSTITLRYGQAYARGTVLRWEVYFPKHLLEDLDPKRIADWEFWTQPTGNGPYWHVRTVPHTLMEFEANSDYYRGKPQIERVILKLAGDVPLAELLSGAVDVIMGAKPGQVPNLVTGPHYRAYFSYDDTYAIFWHQSFPPFRDPRVRRALTLAIDRRELIVVLNLPAHTPLVTGPYTDRQLRLGALPEPLPYDEVWAGALLDSAGWRDANGDGVRERDGRLLRFTALVGSEPGWSPIAVYVQDRLQRVGVQMDIYALEQASLWAKLRLETFDAAFSRAPNDANVWRLWFGRESTIGYANAEVAGLLDRLPMAMDPEEEDQIRHRLALIFRDDVPATFLFPHVHYTIADSRIRGLSSPWRADPLRYMEDLWLENTAAR